MTQALAFLSIFFAAGLWLEGMVGAVLVTRPFQLKQTLLLLVVMAFAGLLWAFVCREFLRGLVEETRVHLLHDTLKIERFWLGRRREQGVKRREVAGVLQVRDGGGKSDSFPSYALLVRAREELKLLRRQDREASAWLGPLIAAWADRPFQPYDGTREMRVDAGV